MSVEDELRQTQQELAEVSGDLDDLQRARLYDAQRRAEVHAEELLHSAMVIVELGGTAMRELDVALEAVKNKAEDVGLLRRQPLQAARDTGNTGPSGI